MQTHSLKGFQQMRKHTTKLITLLLLCALTVSLIACTGNATSSVEVDPIQATVVEIEKFGHAALDIMTDEFTAAGYTAGDIVCVHFDSFAEEMPYFDGYYSNPGSFMLRGLSPEDNIAVCINYGRFADETGIAVGDTVEISLVEKAGMLALQEICSLQYSDNPADYPDTATFANYRAVTLGRIADGKLYRTASPINNERGRAAYANAFIASVGVSTVLNLSDAEEDIEASFEAEDFNSEYYRELYEAGNVIAMDMAADFYSANFAASLAEGLTFLAHHEPPYAVHCLEGKDRAGVTAFLLEALMGAELEEMIDDYSLSFYNYYGISPENDLERYQTILEINFLSLLRHIAGVDTNDELAQVDWEATAAKYLMDAGMTQEDILTLKEKLSE